MNLFDSTNYVETEPLELVVGDRWAWKRTDLDTDYSNASYTLTYKARREGTSGSDSDLISVTASASGSDYLVEVGSSTTADYIAGTYKWQAYITRDSDGERLVIDNGTFNLIVNDAVSTVDPRTHVKITLDAIEAIIEDRATKDQESYSINGRSLARTPIADLLVLRDRYKAEYATEVRAERIAKGLGHKGRILVRF